MADETTGTVSIDLTGVENRLETLTNILSGDEKTIIKDIAIKIFSNTNFDMGKSAYQIAQDSVSYAMIMLDVLKKYEIIKK